MSRALPFAALALAAGLLRADVAPDLQAKFVKVIASHASSKDRVAVEDPAVRAELEKLGVGVDPKAKVAYVATEEELKAKLGGRVLICPRLEWLPLGASIAIVEENGKPAIYVHTGHLEASGVKVAPAIMRLGRN